MNVQELINELETIKDKSMTDYYDNDSWGYREVEYFFIDVDFGTSEVILR